LKVPSSQEALLVELVEGVKSSASSLSFPQNMFTEIAVQKNAITFQLRSSSFPTLLSSAFIIPILYFLTHVDLLFLTLFFLARHFLFLFSDYSKLRNPITYRLRHLPLFLDSLSFVLLPLLLTLSSDEFLGMASSNKEQLLAKALEQSNENGKGMKKILIDYASPNMAKGCPLLTPLPILFLLSPLFLQFLTLFLRKDYIMPWVPLLRFLHPRLSLEFIYF